MSDILRLTIDRVRNRIKYAEDGGGQIPKHWYLEDVPSLLKEIEKLREENAKLNQRICDDSWLPGTYQNGL